MRTLAVGTLLAMLLTGCAAVQTFSESAGSLRVQGRVAQDLVDPQKRTLSLHLSDAQTGRPIEAREVVLRSESSSPVRAVRESPGNYSAKLPDADRVDVLIFTRSHSAVIALQRQ